MLSEPTQPIEDTLEKLTTISAKRSPHRVAYIMSRFPKLTETFILDEILELERCGVTVEIFPLWREKAKVIHPEARALVERAHFTRILDGPILRDNLRCFVRNPKRYLGTIGTLVRQNFRSPRFLIAALAVFPKACHFSERMKSLGVQHLHAHFASHPAAAAWIVGRMSLLPWSFTAHGSDLHREQAMLREKVHGARFAVAISEHNRDFILAHVGDEYAKKVRVIHCGVDLRRFSITNLQAPDKSHMGQHDRAIEIGCIGTLHEVKGQRYLLEACASLSRKGLRFRCHLIGDGPDRHALEDLTDSLGLTKQIIFHGACGREEVRALLAQMDIVVAPSVPTRDGRREGIPVVLMEASACQLPLIASRLSGIPELVTNEENGLLVEPRDVEGLTRALARLIQEPETRACFGKAALRKVENGFSLSESVETLRTEIFSMVSP